MERLEEIADMIRAGVLLVFILLAIGAFAYSVALDWDVPRYGVEAAP
jgi:hypothetical protein